jgi:uncharacterized protein
MKTILFSSLLWVLGLCVHAQKTESITIGKKETLFSTVLNENRRIWVYSPENTSAFANPDKRFPVLYLLDGDAHFYATVGIIQQLSQANGNGVLPEMMVVAIENTNRLRDLVPADDFTATNPFISFISTELIPFIDKNYPTAPYKILAGHSLGGLTVLHTLTHQKDLFNAYIAIDPSMWYRDEKFLNQSIAQLTKEKMNDKRLFIGTANTMPEGMSLTKLKSDQSDDTKHIRSIFKLDNFLQANKNGLLYAHKFYAAERHNTVPLISEYDGLRFIFDYFFLDATEKDFTDSTALIASKLKKHYANVSAKMGYKNAAPASLINYLGYAALGNKQYNKAEALFTLNMEWYPESSHVYDAYADYLLVRKDTSNAVLHYKKSLQLKNDVAIQQKLQAITNPQTLNFSVNDLQKYAGTYTLEAFQLDISLEIRNGKLWAIVPGQADEELQPVSEHVFTIKGKQGYTITFKMNADKPKSFTSVQPDGTFIAVFKNR